MKEIPILFNTEMVQAILEGRKTMTRRIIKTTHHGWDCQKMIFALSRTIKAHFTKISSLIGFHAFFTGDGFEDHKLGTKCPYGQLGDVLWVRETWCLPSLYDGFESDYYFKAGFSSANIETRHASKSWKPSIHMPKEAARIWLSVEEIRVERLRDITQEDAISEGIKFSRLFEEWGGVVPHPKVKDHYRWYANPVDAFNNLWIHINGEESFKANPWLWVVKFRVLSTTGKPSF